MIVKQKPVDHCVATYCHVVVTNYGPNRFRKHDWYGRAWVLARRWARGGRKQ